MPTLPPRWNTVLRHGLTRPLAALLALGLLGGAASAQHVHGAAPAAMAASAATSAPAGAAAGAGAMTRKQRPQLAISAAFAPGGQLWLTGLDEQGRLMLRRSNDAGAHWGPAQLLDTAGDTVLAEGEQRPKLAFGPKGEVLIAYTRPLAKPYTGEIRLLRSADGGRSFAAPVTVHGDRQIITHRFESMAFDARGRLHVVWIDKRDGEAVRLAGADPKSYRGAGIYHAISTDGGASFGPDLRLAEHSCECCRIAIAPTPDGSLAALWRHVFAPNERDHGFARLDGEQSVEPVRATLDHWAIDACPHHGPALTPALDGGYHAVWFGLRDGVAGVRYGRLDADGAPQGVVRPLPDEAAEHADILAAGRQLAIVWRSFDGQATRLRAWVSTDQGRTLQLQELGSSTLDNDYPRLVSRGDALFVLWRTTEGVQVVPLRRS